MKIQRIENIQSNRLGKKQTNEKNKIYNKATNNNITAPIQHSYQDFNISFQGRTPENFYEQDFNIKNMPITMKNFLYENYSINRHIPPEQIMSESFRYLDISSNFSDVKSIYPEEPLFNNLHEPSKLIRKGIIAEIRSSKEIEDRPILKDSNDDLGVYILKKIFLEGKTIKEINKDFYEKDINPEYKGLITSPIDKNITQAFGIRYPKTDFWNSFIATRDEYKKFFVELPKKNKSELITELNQKKNNSINTSQENQQDTNTIIEKREKQKYKIKNYTKEHLKKDLKNTKNDAEAIKKAIRKHFKANDPEANFIVKYLSPIMTIAADRIHLSEEERYFAQGEKDKGHKIDNFFAQFWKANPKLAEFYSTAITDTIELFEETYGAGGMIPINNSFEVITDNTENKKAIDYVSQEFVYLLNHTQSILEKRVLTINKHNNLQKEWNDHFLWKYGKIEEEKTADKSIKEITKQTEEEKPKENVITILCKNGKKIEIQGDINDEYAKYMANDFIGFPESYIRSCISTSLKHPLVNDKFKISLICTQYEKDIESPDLYQTEEITSIMDKVYSDFPVSLFSIARAATIDSLAERSNDPVAIFKYFTKLKANETTFDDTKAMIEADNARKDSSYQEEVNKRYTYYRKPISISDKSKIASEIINYIKNYDQDYAKSKRSLFQINQKILLVMDGLKRQLEDPKEEKSLRNSIMLDLDQNTQAKNILNKVNNPIIKKLNIEAYLIKKITKR